MQSILRIKQRRSISRGAVKSCANNGASEMLRQAQHDKYNSLIININAMQSITLTATIKKPLTQGEWLRHSVGWTLACVVGWLVFITCLSNLLDLTEGSTKVLLLGTAGATHLLIWYKGVLSTWDTVAVEVEPFWLTTVSAIWTFVLLLFQVMCLIVWFLGLILACEASSTSWG